MPLNKLPLTPNGKVDKNALPFPDTAVGAASSLSKESQQTLSPLETQLRDIWSKTLFPPRDGGNSAPTRLMELDENFFDCGGHSILATRLIFQVY